MLMRYNLLFFINQKFSVESFLMGITTIFEEN